MIPCRMKWFIGVTSPMLGLLFFPLHAPQQQPILTATMTTAMPAAPRMTKAEMEALAARGELLWARIELHVSADVQRIADTGVVIWTQEPAYVVIAGDAARLKRLEEGGFAVKTPSESDIKMRWFSARVT